ncbi:MAG TPA: c-type cytochrome biogenesis protein CcmI [Hyphomicrobiaceae bacterium]|nr:c-type cytochrome biogenesis protein CcmI [Hyphomicrobiaceae bacterium]
MLLWILFAAMTAAVLAAVLAPLARAGGGGDQRRAGSLAVYRDQLEELESDRAGGLIDADDAAATKIEISRRLLAGAAASGPRRAPSGLAERWHGRLAIAAAALLPAFVIGLYLVQGSPGMPAFPAAARQQLGAEQAGILELVARVEARLREHPAEGEGWQALAPVYLKLGRYREAANAYGRAAQLNGESAKLLMGFAEASMLANDGVVSEEARRAYERLLKLEPDRVEARFWLAVAKEQDGKLNEALGEYRALLSAAPAAAPWRAAVSERLEDLSRRLGADGKPASPGPSPADVAAAQALSPEERGRMIAGMVDGLAQRLKQNGNDLAGWRRLVNAYVVLDRKGEARAALAEARRNFAGDERALGELSALAASLGLDT